MSYTTRWSFIYVFNLAIQVEAEYLVTWETRILDLATASSRDAEELRRLSPRLKIVTPPAFVSALSGNP